jgi:hypothetical protein
MVESSEQVAIVRPNKPALWLATAAGIEKVLTDIPRDIARKLRE